MAGLYLHIPFCKSRCIYCGFYSTTRLELRQRYVDALCREMSQRPYSPLPAPEGDAISTIYLGGGTPSQLSPAQLEQLFGHMADAYGPALAAHGYAGDMEITLECNPDDVTDDFAHHLRSLPVNRISMGAQTFDDARLRFLHRRHTARQVSQAVDRLRHAGIDNISIDLMFGFPGQTPDEWRHDIDAALSLQAEHLSAYSLMFEEGTVLHERMQEERTSGASHAHYQPIDEEAERLMYDTLIDQLTAHGYEHYEISNFARPGWRSRHNSSYWKLVPYTGLGAAAHSYDGTARRWNVAHLGQYMDGIESGNAVCEREELDAATAYNDRVMLSLRTREGLDLSSLTTEEAAYCKALARKFQDQGLLCEAGNRLRLTRRGLFVSDMVMSELMKV